MKSTNDKIEKLKQEFFASDKSEKSWDLTIGIKLPALIREARIDELEKIPKEPNYGDEGKATEYVEERLNQLSQQTPNN